jgi:molecular chaperone GrpE
MMPYEQMIEERQLTADRTFDGLAVFPPESADVSAEIDRLKEQLLRLRADFANYKKRVARDFERSRDQAAAEVFRLLLPTLDNLESALAMTPSRDESHSSRESHREGIRLIYQDLRTSLGSQGLESLDLVGTPFNPEVAEAVGVDKSSTAAPGTVLKIVRNGWKLRQGLLRPAQVIVSTADAFNSSGGREVDDSMMKHLN